MAKLCEGVIAAMVTLFKEDYSVDEEGIKEQVDFLIEGGVDGILVLGSLGEFMNLAWREEREKVAEIAVKHADKRIPIYVGTMHTSTDEVIYLTKHAQDIGADAVAIVPAYFFPLSDDAVYNHYSAVAEEVDIPIILYNFPACTGTNINPQVVGRLARDYDNIIGIKETIDSVMHMRKCLELTRALDFKVITGNEDHALSILTMGGHGFVSGTANFAPEYTVGIYKSFKEGNLKEAVKTYWDLMKIRQLWNMNVPGPVLIKFVMAEMGRNMKPVTRRPLIPLSEKQKRKAREIIRKVSLGVAR